MRDAGEGDLAVLRPGRGRARLETVLGKASDVEAVLEGLLVQEGERRPFEPHDVPEPSFEGRTDLRDLVTFTIDPETAKDFDDAISVVREGDGLRAWVHIADVAHFVPAGTPLDHGAARRAFSVYVPGRVAPMLPPELSDDACSLRPYVDRLTVTVEVPFDADLNAGEPRFYRSVIRSDERFTYGRVEELLAGRERLDGPLLDALQLAETLTTELRRRRFARGALRIETPELNLSFDGQGGVERGWFEGEPHAHMLVEELMILANECVGGLLSSRRREALYRVHERPDPQAIAHLVAKLAALGGADATRARPGDDGPPGRGARGRAGRRAGDGLRAQVGARPRGLPNARPAFAQAGALPPAKSRPHGPCEPGLLPLHLAHSPVPGPRRAPGPPA